MPSAITSAFRIIDLDSAALAGTATIAHPMKEVGTWRLSLYRDERTSFASIALYVREDASGMLAAVDAGAADAPMDHTIRRGGYLRLVSSLEEGGVFALLRDAEGARTVWDSRSLEGGDVFAFLPLRPGRYVLTDHLGGAERAVRVKYPDPRANKGAPSVMPEPLRIEFELVSPASAAPRYGRARGSCSASSGPPVSPSGSRRSMTVRPISLLGGRRRGMGPGGANKVASRPTAISPASENYGGGKCWARSVSSFRGGFDSYRPTYRLTNTGGVR